MNKLRKESWDKLMEEAGGDHDKAMEILNEMEDKA